MQIVIEIPEEEYKIIKNHTGPMLWVEHLIKKGTPLPKGHGRLIDADEVIKIANKNKDLHSAIWKAPTIIEADRSDKE